MSKKDYTKFSNNKVVNNKSEEIQNGVQDVEVKIEEMANEPIEEVAEEKHQDILGIVIDCDKLNVRKGPSINTDIVCMIDASTNLIVDYESSTDEFYKICTYAGIEGYCMKKFVKIL